MIPPLVVTVNYTQPWLKQHALTSRAQALRTTRHSAPAMIETLQSLLSNSPAVVYECRQCGRTVEPDTRRCPACGADGIASYSVD